MSLLKSEKFQAIHRTLNTILGICILAVGLSLLYPLIDKVDDLEAQRLEQVKVVNSEIAQLMVDEGFKTKPYKDSRGLWTIGVGHLIQPHESFDKLTPRFIMEMLRKDYTSATKDIERLFPWAKSEVKLVLINMRFQLGATGLSKFSKTIKYLEAKEYDNAAIEMLSSKWARQTPNRASRLAGRIMQLTD